MNLTLAKFIAEQYSALRSRNRVAPRLGVHTQVW